MKPISFKNLEASLRLTSALHIGGDASLGGAVSLTARAGLEHQPYIPGSSVKGRMRALLSAPLRHVDDPDLAQAIDRLFGRRGARGALSFWDCSMDPRWVAERKRADLPMTVLRNEQTVMRSAKAPATVRLQKREVVPEGALFRFRVTLNLGVSDRMDIVLAGIKLLEWEGLGACTSRGMGRVQFDDLRITEEVIGAETKEEAGALVGA